MTIDLSLEEVEALLALLEKVFIKSGVEDSVFEKLWDAAYPGTAS